MHDSDSTTTLDVLHRARESLTAGPFCFHDWLQCTCGHLYIGATGSCATRRSEVRSPRADTTYATVVVDVARALSGNRRRFGTTGRRWYDPRSRRALAARWISDYTLRRSRTGLETVTRADALAVIDEAIARLGAGHPEPSRAEPRDVHERQLPA